MVGVSRVSQPNEELHDRGDHPPRVISLPSPRRLLRLEFGLVLAVMALLGGMSAPADRGVAVAGESDAASTTQVTAGLGPDALQWYDEVGRRDRADLVRQAHAVSLPAAVAPVLGTVGPTGPVGPSGPAVPGAFSVPQALWAAYVAAAAAMPESCHLDARLLAAIGQVESGSLAGRGLDARHRAVPPVLGPVLDGLGFASIRDTDAGLWDGDRTWDRAVGPMQFIPSTWARYGRDADADGVADPQDVEDAALSAAGYLCAGGRDLSSPDGLRAAVLAYNHSTSYLAAVLALVPNAVPGGDVVQALAAVTAPVTALTMTASASQPAGSTTAAPTATTAPPSTTSSSSTSTPTTTTASPTTTTSTPTTSTTTSTTTTTTTSTATTTTTATSTTTTTTATSTTTTPSTPPTSSTTTAPEECGQPTTNSATSTTPPEQTTSPTTADSASPTPAASCTTAPAPTNTATASPTTSSANATEAALQPAAATTSGG